MGEEICCTPGVDPRRPATSHHASSSSLFLPKGLPFSCLELKKATAHLEIRNIEGPFVSEEDSIRKESSIPPPSESASGGRLRSAPGTDNDGGGGLALATGAVTAAATSSSSSGRRRKKRRELHPEETELEETAPLLEEEATEGSQQRQFDGRSGSHHQERKQERQQEQEHHHNRNRSRSRNYVYAHGYTGPRGLRYILFPNAVDEESLLDGVYYYYHYYLKAASLATTRSAEASAEATEEEGEEEEEEEEDATDPGSLATNMAPPKLLRRLSRQSSANSQSSSISDTSNRSSSNRSRGSNGDGDLAPPVLVYHANARYASTEAACSTVPPISRMFPSVSLYRVQLTYSRLSPSLSSLSLPESRSIVFRDQLRRANSSSRLESFGPGGGEGGPDGGRGGAANGPADMAADAFAAGSSPPISPNPYATTPASPAAAAAPAATASASGDGDRATDAVDVPPLPFAEKPVPGGLRTTSHHSGGFRTSHHSQCSMESYVITDDPEHKHVDKFATIGACAEHVLHSAVEQDKDLHITEVVPPTQIAGYCERVEPLPTLELGPNDDFQPLLDQDLASTELTAAEAEVVQMLNDQKACVKTIKNTDWTAFLQRFRYSHPPLHAKRKSIHDDASPESSHHFNSFVTSTTLLPSEGKKMRCYGSTSQYTAGVVFALPEFDTPEAEAQAAKDTWTWSWPAGYSAKTEFNRDSRGRLINGREEALVSFSQLREYNKEYVEGIEYTVNRRRVSGINQIPYNEVFLRVGGGGRIVAGKDVSTGEEASRSFETGVGLPVALFCRTATFGHMISLLRTKARLVHTLGEAHKTIPLLMITPDLGIRVLTEGLLQQMWKVAAQQLTPFQNPTIAHRTCVTVNDDAAFQQKLDELIDLDDSMQEVLTPEELARIAGGFGASDESLADILKRVHEQDEVANKEMKLHPPQNGKKAKTSHKLQDVVNEGMASAIRSGDYHTARQLLILYSLVAAPHPDDSDDEEGEDSRLNGDEKKEIGSGDDERKTGREKAKRVFTKRSSSMSVPDTKPQLLDRRTSSGELSTSAGSSTTVSIPMVPPPPPLDTDRLRGATNSDGLLAVLGAAQVLRAMQDGGAKKRTEEAISSVEEWVNYGEQSMAFRISSWYDQRAAQGDLKIATESNSQFMAFVSNKAISNRKAFCQQLRDAAATTNFNDVQFLQALHLMLSKMHSPCLRLELLQYVLGLDNRYSVAHLSRSIELAATCLGISSAASSSPSK